MIYSTGTISINGNTATGSGTNWTAPASQVRAGQTIIVMSNPVQMFQISSVNSATSMTVTPAASPALSGQKYAILVSDIISVDGLAQAMSQLIKEYDENIGAWETFATTSANQTITVTINGTTVTIPGIGKLAQKGSNGAVTVADGGTGATNAADALTNLGLGDISVAGVATGSMGETGYAIFPMMIGGTRKTFIMQWGTLILLRSGGTVDINLPIAFPTMVMQAYATHDNVIQTARPTVYAIAPTSRTTITAAAMSLRADSVGAAVTRGSDSDLCYGRYLAIGY